MADQMETNEMEGVADSASNSGKDTEEGEHVPKLKNVRKGKLSQLTKRKNIMLELMEDVTDIEEVKENLQKYTQLLAEFKSVHRGYQGQLSEDEISKDECEWFEPKMAEIDHFLSLVHEWLAGASKTAKSEPEEEKEEEVEVTAKDSISQVSQRSRGSRTSTVASARIVAEAERAGLMAKAAALKEMHELEERESALQREMRALKQKRDALELRTQLAVSTSKLAVLKSAEQQQGVLVSSPTVKPPSEELPRRPITVTPATGTHVKLPEETLQSEVQDAVQLATDLVELCSKGGFQLTKWVSNNRTVLSSIKPKERGKDIRSLDLDKDQVPADRALGLQWSVEGDDFRFNIVVPQKPQTRRGILSMVSSVYNPLGILAPLTLPAKQLLQQLCKQGYGWDEPISPGQSKQWTDWVEYLPKLASFNVPRCIKPPCFGKPTSIQLHHFADASELGYGVVSYLRMTNKQGGIHVCFLMGKARVAPLKQLTIPRLELAAAVLSVKVDRLLRAELHLPLQTSMFWVDSQAVLKYIGSDSARFHTFVANRVAFIRVNTNIQQWKFIESKHNPADDASRGLSAKKFLDNKRWLRGPQFLWEQNHTWPTMNIDSEPLSHDDPEVKRSIVCSAVIQDQSNPSNKLLSYFSDWSRLMKAIAWYQKFGDSQLALAAKRRQLTTAVITRSRQQNTTSQLQALRLKLGSQIISLDDMERAERAVLSFTQRQAFPVELEKLATMSPCVPKRSKLYRLDPILKDGLLRVGGRLSRAAMSDTMKHPIILPNQSHISSLLLKHIHEKYGHCGRNYILSQMRRKYWILSANSEARKVITKCVTCRRLETKTAEQKMANLPHERTKPNLRPFTNVGMDYFGPIVTRRGRSLVKRYGVIFTCLSCRAIHLEIAYTLDTDSCIHAIRRFVCRRGQVQHIWSDNGTNLVGANKEMKQALSSLNDKKIQGTLLKRGISWTFNPPGASHHGGVWERLIRSVRRVLNALTHHQTLTDEGLQTLFCEVEAILNNRPITTASSDPFDLEPLTPNHILLINTQPVLPPGEFSSTDLYTRRRWKQVQYLADLFWKRWTHEYLALMQKREKWSKERENLRTGDVVVIVDPTSPRSSWPLARILETKPDAEGLVRSVKLKTKTGVLERPITKLCLLLEDGT
ncbi:uncharacterized protein LOC111197647 [Astyanax mexicanus]|uniref:uncharacterized protein LOC111197647 n=1 Tax=Astyanax mexicanus TaxID=7994 RepID=UPI0020CAAFF9|nr:uncharacterized protein LOC111197647 [Astyanax mexicanus]